MLSGRLRGSRDCSSAESPAPGLLTWCESRCVKLPLDPETALRHFWPWTRTMIQRTKNQVGDEDERR
jgi:hypothetical protein